MGIALGDNLYAKFAPPMCHEKNLQSIPGVVYGLLRLSLASWSDLRLSQLNRSPQVKRVSPGSWTITFPSTGFLRGMCPNVKNYHELSVADHDLVRPTRVAGRSTYYDLALVE